VDSIKLFIKEWWAVGTILVAMTILAGNIQTNAQAHSEALLEHAKKTKQEVMILRTICRRLSFTDYQRNECNVQEDN
jgi:cell shape-determining protein MreC